MIAGESEVKCACESIINSPAANERYVLLLPFADKTIAAALNMTKFLVSIDTLYKIMSVVPTYVLL